jgi:hypothetical protein
MAINARNKGKRGEREVRDLLQAIVDSEFQAGGMIPPRLERNLQQVRAGGADLVGLEWLALEVKYREQSQIAQWWEQAKGQAKDGQEPVLIHRSNHQPWQVRMFGYLMPPGQWKERVVTPVDISLEAFLAYLRVRIRASIAAHKVPTGA